MTYYRALSVCSILAYVVACGSDGGGDTAEPSGNSQGKVAFEIFPPKVYSGYDGSHKYQAPVIVHFSSGTGKVTWKISDESIASLEPSGNNVMLTMKKAGTATLTATSGDKSSTAPLQVYAYTAAQYAAGAKRYVTAADADNPACTNCHGEGNGPDRPNHTPTEVDADTDTELQNTFVSGKDPEGRPIAEESEFASILAGRKHMWKVTDAEKTGLLAYLRALAPLGFPEYDAPTTQK